MTNDRPAALPNNTNITIRPDLVMQTSQMSTSVSLAGVLLNLGNILIRILGINMEGIIIHVLQ